MAGETKKAKEFKIKFGDSASDVINEIILAFNEMYIYDNSEAWETREDEIKFWIKVQKKLNKFKNISNGKI